MATCRMFSTLAAALICGTSVFAQAPANDECTNPTALSPGVTLFDSTVATDSVGSDFTGATCGFTFGIARDLWYSFTAPTTDSYDIEVVDGGSGDYDSKLAIYNALTCPAPVGGLLDCDDDDGVGRFSKMTLGLTAGTTYMIRVGSFDGFFTVPVPAALRVIVTPPPAAPPANDDCATAQSVMLGLTAFDSTAATDGFEQALDPAVCDMGTFGDDQIYSDVWFEFTPMTSGFFDFGSTSNGAPDFDSRIAVYDQVGCPSNPANVIGCNDDGDPFTLEALAAGVALVSGQSYLVRVGSYDPLTDEFPAFLSVAAGVAPPAPPTNDDCPNASIVAAGLTPIDSTGATTGTSLALDPAVCDMGFFGDDQIHLDVWFSFTPAVTAFFDVASTNNGNPVIDSRIAIYDQATCPDDPALVIGCDDDSGPNFQALATSVSMTAGQTYLIRVGAYDDFEIPGPAALSITVGATPPPPPANDDCANATALNAFGFFALDNVGATTDGADLAGFCDLNAFDDIVHNDVWYAYTPQASGCTYISTLGLVSDDTKIAVYDSGTCPDDPATVIACSDDEVQPSLPPYEAGLDVDLLAGNTYLIRIGNYESGMPGVSGTFQIAAGPLAAILDGGLQPGAPGCAPAPDFVESCFGDGGNQMGCTNCPCGNEAPIGSGGGCLNSASTGIRLLPSGSASLALPSGDTTDLRFGAAGAPPTAFCILNSGDGVAPGNMANPCFGMNSGAQAAVFDGLRCAIMNTRRHGGRSADANGEVGVTNNPWGGEGGPPVGIGNAGGGFAAGQTRYFQIINRDDPLAVCMRGLNTSQAVEVVFTP